MGRVGRIRSYSWPVPSSTRAVRSITFMPRRIRPITPALAQQLCQLTQTLCLTRRFDNVWSSLARDAVSRAEKRSLVQFGCGAMTRSSRGIPAPNIAASHLQR